MAKPDPEARRLAAILFTDIVGYTALMGRDEAAGWRVRKRHESVVRPLVARYHGQWVEERGDESLSVFWNDRDAVNCALAIQAALADDPELQLRIGIHCGDVSFARGRVIGDGVNVASRIRALAEPGGISVSGQVYDSIRNQSNCHATAQGERQLKNVDHPMALYAVTGAAAEPASLPMRLRVRVPSRRVTRWAAAPVGIAAIAGLALGWWHTRSPQLRPIPSVAVLPFVNMSEDAGNEYFGDGLSEDILNSLSKLKHVKVSARTSSFYFKNKDVDIPTIAQHLGVRHVLEGSVRRQGRQLRVTAQLIRAETGFHVWSQTYDRELQDALGIQSDIARHVAEALEVVLSSDSSAWLDRQSTASLEAYEFYLQGKSYLRRPEGEGTLERAEALFEKAVAIDVAYAAAYAGLCDTYLLGYERIRSTSLFEKAERACHRALTLDSTAGDVHTALGNLYRNSGQYHEAERNFERAITLNANAVDAYTGLALTYERQSRLEEAEKAYQRAIEIQPRFWRGHLEMGNFLFANGRAAEAIEYFRLVTDLTPENPTGHLNLGSAYYMIGGLEQAEAAWRRSVELLPSQVAYRNLGSSLFFLGRFEEAIEMYERAIELAPEDHESWGALGDACRFAEAREERAIHAYRKAMQLAEELLRVNPSDAGTTAMLAHYCANVGEPERARTLMAEALELAPESMYVLYDAAVMHVSLGETEPALAAIERAVELGYPPALIRVDAGLAPLRETDRFASLVSKAADREVVRR